MPTESIRMLRGVRQTREFQDRPVPDDALHDILEVARWSGSSRNSQPWELVVIADRDTMQRLAELISFGKFLARAPLGIAVVMRGPGQGQSLDAGRIAERMMIAAHARGLGAGLATIPDPALERLSLECSACRPGTASGSRSPSAGRPSGIRPPRSAPAPVGARSGRSSTTTASGGARHEARARRSEQAPRPRLLRGARHQSGRGFSLPPATRRVPALGRRWRRSSATSLPARISAPAMAALVPGTRHGVSHRPTDALTAAPGRLSRP